MLFRKLMIASALSASLLLSTPMNDASAKGKDYTILNIDGTDVKHSEVLKIWNNLFPNGSAPDFDGMESKLKINVLRGVVSEQLIYKAAQESGIEKNKDVQEKFTALKKKIITQAYLEREADSKVSEADIKKAYAAKKKEIESKEEAHARHILVKTEEEAKKIMAQAKAGKDFAALAKEKSTDKGSGSNGGDLGFFTAERMVPEFSKAAFALKKGEISAPVKSNFGWHVIKLEEKRKMKAPSYKEMHDKLENQLKGEVLEKIVQNMVDSAKVKYFNAKGGDLELTTTPDTSKK